MVELFNNEGKNSKNITGKDIRDMMSSVEKIHKIEADLDTLINNTKRRYTKSDKDKEGVAKKADELAEEVAGVNDKVDEVGKKVDEEAKNQKKLSMGEKLRVLLKNSKKGVELLKEQIYAIKHDYSKKAIPLLMDQLSKIKNSIKEGFEKAKNKVVDIKDKVKSKGLGGFVKMLALLVGSTLFIKKVWPLIKDKIIPFLNEVILPFINDKLIPTIKDIFTNKVIPFMSEIFDVFTEKVLPVLKNNIMSILGGIGLTTLLTNPSLVLGIIGRIVSGLAVTLITGSVKLATKLAFSAMKIPLNILKASMISTAKSAKSVVSSLASGTVKTIKWIAEKTGISRKFQEIKTKLAETYQVAKTKMMRLAGKVGDAGRSIANSRAGGMARGAGRGVAAVGGVMATTGKGILKVFGKLAHAVPFLGTILMVWDLLDMFFPELTKKISSLFSIDKITEIGETIWKGITGFFSSDGTDGTVMGWVTAKWDSFIENFSFKELINGFVDFIFGGGVAGLILDGLTSMLGKDNIIVKTVTKIGKFIGGIFTGIKNYFADAFERMTIWISDKVRAIPVVGPSIADTIFGEKRVFVGRVTDEDFDANKNTSLGDLEKKKIVVDDSITDWGEIRMLSISSIRELIKNGNFDDGTKNGLERIIAHKIEIENKRKELKKRKREIGQIDNMLKNPSLSAEAKANLQKNKDRLVNPEKSATEDLKKAKTDKEKEKATLELTKIREEKKKAIEAEKKYKEEEKKEEKKKKEAEAKKASDEKKAEVKKESDKTLVGDKKVEVKKESDKTKEATMSYSEGYEQIKKTFGLGNAGDALSSMFSSGKSTEKTTSSDKSTGVSDMVKMDSEKLDAIKKQFGLGEEGDSLGSLFSGGINGALGALDIGASDKEAKKYREGTGNSTGLIGSILGIGSNIVGGVSNGVSKGADKISSYFGADATVKNKRPKDVQIDGDTKAMAKSTAKPKPVGEKADTNKTTVINNSSNGVPPNISIASSKKRDDLLPYLGELI